jgi:alkylation response protein AidB-like acyl-CoA dehydrogenase
VRVRSRIEGSTSLDPAAWSEALVLGRRAVSHQIEGGCRTMRELARGHALAREQFGRPIARFQAVRHRLAEAWVASPQSTPSTGPSSARWR